QNSHRPTPPATTQRFPAKSGGFPSRGIRRKNSRKRSEAKCLATSGTSAANPPRSAPAQKALSPAPVSTTALASSESRAVLIASTSSASIWPESMLRLSGLSSVTVATPSPTSYLTSSSSSSTPGTLADSVGSRKCYCPRRPRGGDAARIDCERGESPSGNHDYLRLEGRPAGPRRRAQ